MRQIALGILGLSFLATPVFAQEPAKLNLGTDRVLGGVSSIKPARTFTLSLITPVTQAPTAEPDPTVTVAVGADIPSLYIFRGYRQETDPAFTFQPFVDVGVQANERVKLNIGSWNSIHTGSIEDTYGAFYESDFYAAATIGMLKTTYTAYMYPEIDDSTIHELMFSTTFDDSASRFPLAPSVALAFELAKPEGLDKGIYLELGVAPAIPLGDDAPVSISIPVRVGVSLKDYYGDDALGYVSGGVSVSRPVNDMLEIHGSVIGYGFPSDVLKAVNNNKSGTVVGSIGFGISF